MNESFQSDAAKPVSGTVNGKTPRWRRWLTLPREAIVRLGVLFLALAVIKVALLFGVRKQLYETHWRVTGVRDSWLDYVAFYGFALVGVVSLCALARSCRAVGVKAVRWANVVVVGLGLLFIFLTFHEGNRNYIYRIMEGTLEWSGLIPYLNLNLFFRRPYLAVWMAVYGIAYFCLVRKGREDRALYLTAAAAGLYWVICLQEFLHQRRELFVCVAVGAACSWTLFSNAGPIRARWLLLPLAWTLMIWLLFSGEVEILIKLTPYFALLIGELAVLFVAIGWPAVRWGFRPAWVTLGTFYFVSFVLLACQNYPMSENYKSLFGFAVSCPHYFLGELILVCCCWLFAVLARRFFPTLKWWWLDMIILGAIVLAVVDLRLTQIMGVRLSCDLISFADSPRMMWRMAQPYLPRLTLFLAIAVGIYFAVVRFLAKRRVTGEPVCGDAGARWACGLFMLLALVGVGLARPDVGEGQSALRLVQSSKFWKRLASRPMSPEEFRNRAETLGMEVMFGAQRGSASRPRRDLNVVIIFMESSYNKYLSLFGGMEDTQPLLSQYKDRMELFPNFFSSFASSIHARFATFTGLYPVSDFNTFTLERVGVKSIFEVLDENGYSCSLFYSSYFDYTGFRHFLKQRGIAEMYDADTMPGADSGDRVAWGLREEDTLKAIQEKLRAHASTNARFCLTYVPAAPHYPYDCIPERFRKHKALEVGNYEPLYLNEMLYMDWVITSILDELKSTGLLEKTLVVITADHGEMLGGKDGTVGHGWRVTPELANVPLIILDPEKTGTRTNSVIGSQVDVLPTLLDSLGIPLPKAELYQGRSLYADATGEKSFVLNSYQDYAVVKGDRMIISNRQGESAGQETGRVIFIQNIGASGKFVENKEELPVPFEAREFDKFQESLLRNYSIYRDSLVGGSKNSGGK